MAGRDAASTDQGRVQASDVLRMRVPGHADRPTSSGPALAGK